MSQSEDNIARKALRKDISGENVLPGLDKFSVEARIALNAKQAKIDALMLEYCPDEMTEAQATEWALHQARESSVMKS